MKGDMKDIEPRSSIGKGVKALSRGQTAENTAAKIYSSAAVALMFWEGGRIKCWTFAPLRRRDEARGGSSPLPPACFLATCTVYNLHFSCTVSC